ncbi:MAG: hypothetical protein M9953_13975 [Thermomicrobiales bacterium]|nr:hypothetical protein [Thermomicrobiales bacterium]MCO5226442.1 hypothetical protein [Thermomicrobiales bacterium]MCO5226863.1 hypothetical protein [Thermomicrobiales bacterium]
MVKSIIEGFNIFRVTNRGGKALLERIVGQGLPSGSGRKPLRDFRVLEIRKLGGSDYFVGLKVNELEFKELTFTPEAELY